MSTLERLVDGVLQASFTGSTPPAWLLHAVDDGLASVCLYGDNLGPPEQLASITTTLLAANNRLLIAADEEGGDVTRLEWATGSSYPGNAALGEIDDVDLTEAVASAIGADLAATGIGLNLAPVLDVNSEPANPVIGVRSFGDEPELVARHGTAFIRGLRAAGVAACAKHFPGHGATSVDSHHALPVLDIDETTLRTRELVPFRAAIAAGVDAIMTAHIVVTALASSPATISRRILTDLLRDELGFSGVIVSDALDMGGISAGDRRRGIPAAAVASLSAGADLLCLGPAIDEELLSAVKQAVVTAVADGAFPEKRLAEAAERVERLPRLGERPRQLSAEIGRVAAERALRIDGTLPGPVRGAHVVELGRPANIAAGDVPWGVGAALAAIDPATTVARDTDVDIPDRPLVLVVRDPQRHADQADRARRLLAARPDAIVVDMGWPSGTTGAVTITTFGASRASGEAVARLLCQRSPATQAVTDRSSAGAPSLASPEGS